MGAASGTTREMICRERKIPPPPETDSAREKHRPPLIFNRRNMWSLKVTVLYIIVVHLSPLEQINKRHRLLQCESAIWITRRCSLAGSLRSRRSQRDWIEGLRGGYKCVGRVSAIVYPHRSAREMNWYYQLDCMSTLVFANEQQSSLPVEERRVRVSGEFCSVCATTIRLPTVSDGAGTHVKVNCTDMMISQR